MDLRTISRCFSILAIISGCIACGNVTSENESVAQTAQQVQAPVQTAAVPQLAASSGKVLEKQDAGRYTYVRLDDGAGNETWAALPKTPLKIGEQITLTGQTVMRNFSSKILNRTFDSIIFATGVTRGSGDTTVQTATETTGVSAGAVQAHADTQGMTASLSGGSAGAIAPFIDKRVEKSTAANAYTVGDLFAKADSLNKQKVTVKGQVVKISPGIMGRNWLHIQDGTGDPMKNTHDLVVTSAAMAQKGDVISLEGILAVDKDFGFGYRYDVIVEDAAVVR